MSSCTLSHRDRHEETHCEHPSDVVPNFLQLQLLGKHVQLLFLPLEQMSRYN